MSFSLPLFRHATRGALASLLLVGVASSALAFNQSPMLDDLVKAGKLPPVDQRLPEKPAVMDVFGEVGTYGGTLHRA
jgi:peptide/nickel transport system substrate-binding protein